MRVDRTHLFGDFASDQKIPSGLLHHTQFASIQCHKLCVVHVHATDLAAVFKIARLIGIRLIQCLTLKQLLNLQLALATQPRLLSSLLLDALALAGLVCARIA